VSRENLPVIPDEHLVAMRTVDKPAPYGWLGGLLDLTSDGVNRRGRYYLPDRVEFGPVHGTLFLFVRVALANSRDFSAGLGFYDDADNGPYRLVRCNGFHPSGHRNHIEGQVILPETRHIHYATERYIKASKRHHDDFAVLTDAYVTLRDCIDHLAGLVHLVPDDRMFV
jgi:hypothetical protein